MLIYTIHSKLASDNRKHNQNEIQLFEAYLACYFVKMLLYFTLLCQSLVIPNHILPCTEVPSPFFLPSNAEEKKNMLDMLVSF